MPEDLKLSQIGSSQLPPPFRGLHSPGVRKHCQIVFACYFRKSSIIYLSGKSERSDSFFLLQNLTQWPGASLLLRLIPTLSPLWTVMYIWSDHTVSTLCWQASSSTQVEWQWCCEYKLVDCAYMCTLQHPAHCACRARAKTYLNRCIRF